MTLEGRIAPAAARAAPTMPPREWALAYARLGWRAFPVVTGEKRPLYKGWQRDATTDPAVIARTWRAQAGPNIGVVCGEAFDAFDIEAEHLGRFQAWAAAHGHVAPETPIARTGRGGIHIIVQPTGVGGGRNLYLGDLHIGELKSVGGFIVVCPSVTVERYAWLRWPDGPPAAAPQWLLGLIARPRANIPFPPSVVRRHDPERLHALTGAVLAAGVGRRNQILYWAMRRAVEESMTPRGAGVALARAALSAGLDEREVEATIRSAYTASVR